MLGLMYLGAASLYLALMFVVVRWAWRKGRADGGSRVKASSFALIGFLAVYLPAFWNHIPIVLAHRAMCAKDAGLVVHMPAEQWYAQHREQLLQFSRLARSQREKVARSYQGPNGFRRHIYAAELLLSDHKEEDIDRWGVRIVKVTSRIVDAKTSQPLATAVDYRTQQHNVRLWLNVQGCVTNPPALPGKQTQFLTPFDELSQYERNLTRGPQ